MKELNSLEEGAIRHKYETIKEIKNEKDIKIEIKEDNNINIFFEKIRSIDNKNIYLASIIIILISFKPKISFALMNIFYAVIPTYECLSKNKGNTNDWICYWIIVFFLRLNEIWFEFLFMYLTYNYYFEMKSVIFFIFLKNLEIPKVIVEHFVSILVKLTNKIFSKFASEDKNEDTNNSVNSGEELKSHSVLKSNSFEISYLFEYINKLLIKINKVIDLNKNINQS